MNSISDQTAAGLQSQCLPQPLHVGGAKVVTKQASVTARRQHKGLAAQVVQFRPVRNHSAAYPTVRTDQFQRLPAGKNGHPQLFQSL